MEAVVVTVAQIDDYASPVVHDELECALQLSATIADKRTEDIAGQTFAVHMHRNAIGGCRVAMHKGEMFTAVGPIVISHSREFPLGQW